MNSNSYSILIICINGIPGHLIRFVRNLKQTNPEAHISLFSNRNREWFPNELNDYIDDFIQQKEYSGRLHRLWKFRPWFDRKAFVKQFKELSKTNHYNIVDIHFPQFFLCYVMKYIRKMCNTIVISPWGSDVLRVNDPKVKKKLFKVFQNCDYVTTRITGNTGKVINEEMKVPKEKFHLLGWGSETIDYINEHISEVSKEQAKELLNLNGRYLITCGYNAFESQRHEIIINAINGKRDQLPDNMTLLFPVTYGNCSGASEQAYINKLKTLCSDLQLSVVFYEDYLSVAELFLLRRATDMFIHIQNTDAGNSSLQEYVLCGAKVVHGAWIHYTNLEAYKPLFYYPVNELDELGNAIVDAYHAEPIQTPKEVLEIIRDRGWKAKMKLWNDFFVSCNNN